MIQQIITRVPADRLDLIDQAAKMEMRNRSSFVAYAALKEAKRVLEDGERSD